MHLGQVNLRLSTVAQYFLNSMGRHSHTDLFVVAREEGEGASAHPTLPWLEDYQISRLNELDQRVEVLFSVQSRCRRASMLGSREWKTRRFPAALEKILSLCSMIASG